MDKKALHLLSFSGGKDSTALLLKLLEHNQPLDCIFFCDTGLEFPEMYEHIAKVEKDINKPIIRLKAEKDFKYYMFDVPRKQENKETGKMENFKGYGWANFRVRWCTVFLKNHVLEHFVQSLKKEHTIIQYVGFALDEKYRMERISNKKKKFIYPLVNWEMTEKDCLKYCYSKGYDWNGLYNIFEHVSCWCCPLQSYAELRKLYNYFPQLWDKLKQLDSKTTVPFKHGYSVEQLEMRFNFEKERIEAGKSITNKEFYTELKKYVHRH